MKATGTSGAADDSGSLHHASHVIQVAIEGRLWRSEHLFSAAFQKPLLQRLGQGPGDQETITEAFDFLHPFIKLHVPPHTLFYGLFSLSLAAEGQNVVSESLLRVKLNFQWPQFLVVRSF